jgi:hypothetical protein
VVGQERPVALAEGDAIMFEADVPRSYRNLEPTKTLPDLVMTNAQRTGRPIAPGGR